MSNNNDDNDKNNELVCNCSGSRHSSLVTRHYLAFPPRMADDIEIVERRDGDRLAYVVGSAKEGRFILLGEVECRVLRVLTGTLTPAEVCEEFKRLYNAKLTLPTLTRFLTQLDEAGILAGQRNSIAASSNLMPGPQSYLRWKLFNPDRLFEKMVSRLGWIWTKGFVIITLMLMGIALILAMTHPAEVSSYALYTLREHYLAILIAGVLIGFSHEFAHGLTCKAFGGPVPEVGVLMIYYLLPALYCNVSGAYLIPQRNRRLWVILAGVYWQVLVGAFALLTWFVVEPHTVVSDVAFIFFLAGVVDVIFNANPLIKLDGYYFLSQWLRLPNLMDRSRVYWRGLLKKVLFGERDNAVRRWRKREQAIYLAFGLMSFVYTIGLRAVIVFYAGSYLADQFNVAGLMFAAGLSVFYMRQPLEQVSSATRASLGRTLSTLGRAIRRSVMKNSDEAKNEGPPVNVWRRRIVWLGLTGVAAAVLCVPWTASVGGYGTLVTIPGLETVVRAPENATLIELRAQPGDVVNGGSLLARMGNLELDEQIVQAQSDLARANADYERLSGELSARDEAAARAELQLSLRRHEFNEINVEQEQIKGRVRAEGMREVRFVNLTTWSDSSRLSDSLARSYSDSPYPAALAALQADVDRLSVQLQEASLRARRSRELFDQGVLPRSEVESTEARAASISLETVRARELLEAALIEHDRKHTGSSIELGQANSDLRAQHLQTELLGMQLRATRELIGVLDSRLDLLRRKQAQFELVTPSAGTVYGEDLPRQVRRYFQKGEEICRVADIEQLLVRIQVPEREIGDVKLSDHVRLRVRAYPDRVFEGTVSKIGGESERDEHNQATYRVELLIRNAEGLLRPGMTAFARVDFDRQTIGQILIHKVRQMSRPEIWMF